MKGVHDMAVMDGCAGRTRTLVLEERKCPKCGADVEVFTLRGRIAEKTTCDCGYVFEIQEQIPHVVRE